MKRPILIAGIILLLTSSALYRGTNGKTVTNSLGMRLVQIEPGHFSMGTDLDRNHWMESPVRGRRAITSVLLGSVSHQVTHRSDTPVLLVPPIG